MSNPSIHNHLTSIVPIDSDPQETVEWQQSLTSLLQTGGPQRVREIMDILAASARDPSIGWQPTWGTPNEVPVPRSVRRIGPRPLRP